jgi:sugar lactone lactonase YvrE
VDGALVAAHFQEPWEIVSDGAHTLYVADANVIRAIDQMTGTVTTLAGSYGHNGDSDGVGTQATFSLPSGFAFSKGILYLSDTENLTLRQVEVASGAVTTIAGTPGARGDTDGPASQALFGEPEGIALDPSGKLYVSDTDNNLIRVLDLKTMTVSTLAGGGPSVSALVDGVGTAAAFYKPKAMRMDSAGNLYVCDAFNAAVRKVVPSTATVTTLATFESAPQGLAVDGSDLLVSLEGESGASRIVRLAADGSVTTVAGSTMAAGFVDGVGTAALFNAPAGLYADRSGNLYIADSGNFALRRMTIASADVVTYAGALSAGSADGTGTEARFSAPQGLAVDDTTAYVADTGNDTIRTVDLTSGKVTTLAGAAGQRGNVDGPVAKARFDGPTGLALDSAGQVLYVGDMLNRVIRRIDLAKGVVSTLSYDNGPGYGGLDGPSGLALDGTHLYVADSIDDDVVAVDLNAGQISLVAGQFDMPGTKNGVSAGAAFYAPTGVSVDGLGHLYVADNQAGTVRRIVEASATVSTLAGRPDSAGYADGIGAAALFAQPFALTTDGIGDVFVSDPNNNAVRHVDVSTGAVTTVIGSPSLPGVKLGPLPAQLTLPSAVALTPGGSLLVVSENSVLIAH